MSLPTIPLKAGHSYRRRDGEKVTIDFIFPKIGDHEAIAASRDRSGKVRYWWLDGLHMGKDKFDLVADWEEEPACDSHTLAFAA